MLDGRGRLSSIEMIGEDYEDIKVWATGELNLRTRPQSEILVEFNARLEVRARELGDDFVPISRSAFNRYSMQRDRLGREMMYAMEISRVLIDRIQPGDSDTLTIVAAEAIKTAIFQRLSDEKLEMKDIKAGADALKSANVAQKTSSDRKSKLDAQKAEQEAQEANQRREREREEAAANAVEAAVTEAGISADRAAEIRRKVLGVRTQAAT